MKFYAINDDGLSPVRYLAVDDYGYEIAEEICNEMAFNPRLFAANSAEIITDLVRALQHFESGLGMMVDGYGNFYNVEKSPVPWAKYLITRH